MLFVSMLLCNHLIDKEIKKIKTYYSTNKDNEMWTENDIDEVIIECLDNLIDIPKNKIIEVYSGELQTNKPSLYLPEIIEQILDNAESEHGEYDHVSDWLNDANTLQNDFNDWFDSWCKENNKVPDFGYITNIKTIKILVNNFDVDNYDYETIK